MDSWQIWFSTTEQGVARPAWRAYFCALAAATSSSIRNPFETYFVTHQQRVSAKRPLELAELSANFDVLATVKGGGVSAQADAVKMGIARALLEFNLELRKTLKADGLLSRDARIKERKKYGQKGARKRFQFSKR